MSKFIKFVCPACGQSIEAPPEIIGQPVICPTCNREFVPPKISWTRSFFRLNKTSLVIVVVLFILAARAWHVHVHDAKQYADFLSQQEQDNKPETAAERYRRLKAEAEESMLEDCSNNVVGLTRIVSKNVNVDPNDESKCWAYATVEYVNKVGGIERKDVWFVMKKFDTLGEAHFFVDEDGDRFFCDKLGDATAQYKMGIRYLKGDRVPQDTNYARDYFEKSAVQGNQDAIDKLKTLPP